MNAYQRYMDAIRLTGEEHAALMAALAPPARHRGHPRALAAVCACCLLALLGRQAAAPARREPAPHATGLTAQPAVTAADPWATPEPRVFSGPAPVGTQPVPTYLPWSPPDENDIESYIVEVAPQDRTGGDVAPYRLPPAPAETADSGVAAEAPASLTLADCRSDPLFGPHLPAALPEGFALDSAGRTGEGALSLLWTKGSAEIHVRYTKPGRAPDAMDVSAPSRYDVRLYPAPWSETVPADVWAGGFEDPVFPAEELTEDVLAARAQDADGGASGLRFRLQVLYPDGVLAAYRLKGLTLEEAAALLGL